MSIEFIHLNMGVWHDSSPGMNYISLLRSFCDLIWRSFYYMALLTELEPFQFLSALLF